MAAASSSSSPPPLVQVADLPGRGRSLVATRHIKPGEIVLSNSPLFLYPSSPAASDADDHAALLRAAHSLSLSSPSSFHQLLSLHAAVPTTTTAPPSLTATLLAVDRSNAFALADARLRVSAYAIYPLASFFNHDCLPNACRFDYPDRLGSSSADITVRALHHIPPGREVCLSYFPVNWGYKERQARQLEDYGFRCDCDRCRVEVNWKDDDEENMEEDDGDEGMAEEEEGDGDFPHAYFFVKFVCDVENCGGMLAPLPLSDDGTVSDVLECNVCGKLRKEGDGEDGDGEMDDD